MAGRRQWEVKEREFRKELEELLNRHSRENGSNTPDFLLAEFLLGCLHAFDSAVNRRRQYYGTDEDA